ncbi:MAG: ATP-binding protein [Oscillospiraceae bacterium]|nr:ATP-binding protein [Oscillospiraceae bacterium]
MAYSEQVRQQAADRLEARRLWYAQKTADDRERILREIPALSALEQDIAQLGVSAARAALGGEETSSQALRAQLDEMKAREAAMLEANGCEADALQPQHYCAVCRDTGRAPAGGTCECLKKLLAACATREVNRVSPLRLCSFDSFSLDYYSDAADAEYGVSPRENMRDTLEICRGFARDFPRCEKSLLLFGDAGLGKTHLALSIASRVLERGFDVVYCSAADVLRQIETEFFENGRDTSTLASLKDCSLLIFDDLGAEYVSAFTRSALYDLVNTRINAGRPCVFTTNFIKQSELMARYGEKISSRLLGCCRTLPFFGEDIRLMKNAD